jgi:MFS family permease
MAGWRRGAEFSTRFRESGTDHGSSAGGVVVQSSMQDTSDLRAQHPEEGRWKWTVALSTVAILICYADRSNVSVAILEMARQFDWDDSFKGTILSVFFLGYSSTQLIGGTLADRYGGKTILTVGVVTWSAFTFLTPDAAMAGTATLIACRISMGLGEVCLASYNNVTALSNSAQGYLVACWQPVSVPLGCPRHMLYWSPE